MILFFVFQWFSPFLDLFASCYSDCLDLYSSGFSVQTNTRLSPFHVTNKTNCLHYIRLLLLLTLIFPLILHLSSFIVATDVPFVIISSLSGQGKVISWVPSSSSLTTNCKEKSGKFVLIKVVRSFDWFESDQGLQTLLEWNKFASF